MKGDSARLHTAGVKVAEDGAVTWKGEVVGTVWEDGIGAWFGGADGRCLGPYPNQFAAVVALFDDFNAERRAM